MGQGLFQKHKDGSTSLTAEILPVEFTITITDFKNSRKKLLMLHSKKPENEQLWG